MARRLHDIRGGLRLASHKQVTRNIPSRSIPLSEKLYLPLQQHVGIAAFPCVEVGQSVQQGELIAESSGYVGMRMHAPAAATISAINDYPVVHPSGHRATCIELTTTDSTSRLDPCTGSPEVKDWTAIDRQVVYERIERAGIVGLGGAGFPAHVKVHEGTAQSVETLIINGVECEPYITCDDRLMQENPRELVAGAELIARTIQATNCIIAFADDMTAALTAVRCFATSQVELVRVPALYPAGSEKQLITVLTGIEVPSGLLPIHVGVAVLNVATVIAIYRAVIYGQALTERMVTVAGAIREQGNVRVPIGTPVKHVLEQFGGFDKTTHRVLSGGPMMGTEILDIRAPIIKTTTCLLVLERRRTEHRADACIRCGDCLPVCPVGLQPQQLYEAARVTDVDLAQDLHLFDCIECGCCAYVCPSRIPLIHYFRYAKSSVEALDQDRLQADAARLRFDHRQARLAANKQANISHDVVLADVSGRDASELQSEVRDAVARVRQRRQDQTGD